MSRGHHPVATRRFPTLTVATPRLTVRQLTMADVARVVAVFADRQAARWLAIPDRYGEPEGAAWCSTLAERRRDRGDGDHYGVVRRADDRLIGCAWTSHTDWDSRSTEVWFTIMAAARGFGLAKETVDALTVSLLGEQGFQRIELRLVPGNLAARRVAEKCGFSYEGLLRNAGQLGGDRVDLELWSLVAADLRRG